ncbi:YadA-like family protein [Burkholderia pyrrocinia]|uniref:YadA-like family protein n=1 Tax=Burkholderia pyrrocinia TaxID=60550 RepID=UPI0014054D43|nr:YadA-like family protein [Burkholderia pyrrocinia]
MSQISEEYPKKYSFSCRFSFNQPDRNITNKTYRNVWNAATGTWTAVAETAKGRSKGSTKITKIGMAAAILMSVVSASYTQSVNAAPVENSESAEARASETDDNEVGGPADSVLILTAPSRVATSGSDLVSHALSPRLKASKATGEPWESAGDLTLFAGTTAALDDKYIKTSIGSLDTAASQYGVGTVAIGAASQAGNAQTAPNAGYGTAIGYRASASGDYSVALGVTANALGTNSTAIGYGANVSTGGDNSIAIGRSAKSFLLSGIAIGDGANLETGGVSGASGSIAIGKNATAAGSNSIVIGTNTKHSGSGATVLGGNASAMGGGGVALGVSASAASTNSVALGKDSIANRGSAVSVGSNDAANGFTRQIINVSKGTGDTDAANIAQLKDVAAAIGGGATVDANGTIKNPSFVLNGTTYTNVGAALTGVDNRVKQNTSDITKVNSALSDGTIGQVKQDASSRNITVASGLNGSVVDFKGTVGARKLTNVATGTVLAGSVDAINGGQLYGTASGLATALGGGAAVNADGTIKNPSFVLNGTTYTNVGAALTGVDSRVKQNSSDITEIQNAMEELSDSTGLVQQSGAGADITVGALKDGAAVDFTGTEGARVLKGVADGEVSADSKEAVSGSQLYATNEAVSQNTLAIAGNTTSITSLDGRVGDTEKGIEQMQSAMDELSDGTVGLVQQSGAGADITVGALKDGAAVDFTGTEGARVLMGVADGEVIADSMEAVNGSQLHATNQDVSQNTQAIANNTTSITNLDGRVGDTEKGIEQMQSAMDELSDGTVGLVQQSGAGADITVGALKDGAAVDFTGTEGARVLKGVAEGEVSADSMEAVNGSQLHATNQAVSKNTQDIESHTASIMKINEDLSNGALGLVQQDGHDGTITVARSSGGSLVDFTGADGMMRRIGGVANGIDDDDVVTVSQMNATLAVDIEGRMLTAMKYDDIGMESATLAGTHGTKIMNLAGGAIEAGSMEAVNGGQLYALQQDFENRYNDLNNRVEGLEGRVDEGEGGGWGPGPGDDGNGGIGGGSVEGPGGVAVGEGSGVGGDNGTAIGNGSSVVGDNGTSVGNGSSVGGDNGTSIGQGSNAGGSNSSAIGQGSNAGGDNSTAIGQGSNAGGNNSSAIGQNASASGNNSVALGAGSVADRDNAVSVGSEGSERQITNVAEGTKGTDAVNLNQVNSKFSQLNGAIDSSRKDAFGGVAAAMAVAGLPQPTQPGSSMVSVAGATYAGQSGVAFGVSHVTRDNKWVVKFSGNTSSRGDGGVVLGAGYQW